MKITVVTVCFNCATEIEATIKSVVNQSYRDLEYIIIDGGSSDGTLVILEKYSDCISKIVSEPDKGIYDAMNKATDLATGEWINFMNAGDTFANEYVIENFFRIADLKEPNDILYGDTILKYPFGSYYRDCRPTGTKHRWCHQSMFIRTSVIKKFRYDLSFKIRADYNFVVKATDNGSNIRYVPTVVACYKNYDGLSSTRSDLFAEETYIIENKPKDWKYWLFKLDYFRRHTLHLYCFWKNTESRIKNSIDKNPRLKKM
ncbi:MAG: glycosyltransferase [Bacteroidaceae bacterium]|nr:glycosyltransferase [Bacteroidaceae bacterium]